MVSLCIGFLLPHLPLQSFTLKCSPRPFPNRLPAHKSLSCVLLFREPWLRQWRVPRHRTLSKEPRKYCQETSSGGSYHVIKSLQVPEPQSPHSWNGLNDSYPVYTLPQKCCWEDKSLQKNLKYMKYCKNARIHLGMLESLVSVSGFGPNIPFSFSLPLGFDSFDIISSIPELVCDQWLHDCVSQHHTW